MEFRSNLTNRIPRNVIFSTPHMTAIHPFFKKTITPLFCPVFARQEWKFCSCYYKCIWKIEISQQTGEGRMDCQYFFIKSLREVSTIDCCCKNVFRKIETFSCKNYNSFYFYYGKPHNWILECTEFEALWTWNEIILLV